MASETKQVRIKFARKYQILSFLSVTVVVLDQITKLEVLERFRLGESISIIENFFNLTYVRNTGAAFGFLASANPAFRVPFFVIVPLIALAVISYVFKKIPATDFRLSSALALVMGGAVGNLIDRLKYGYVVDFLDFHWQSTYHFPAFNVADSAICIGVGLLMLDLFKQEQLEQNTKTKGASRVSSAV